MKLHRLFVPLLTTIVSTYLAGCFQSKHKELEHPDISLVKSTQTIESYTMQEYNILERKLHDPTISDRVITWIRNAEMIEHLTTAVHASVDSCFTNYNNVSFDETKSGLNKIVGKYKSAVLQVDSELSRTLSNEFSLIIDSNYFKNFDESGSRNYFKDKVHNSIALIANNAIGYCNGRTGPGCILTYEKFSALVGQNSTHFKSGDSLEVMAGVGEFTRLTNPKIMINNEKTPLNDDGCALFKKTISGKPGTYSVPVVIDYTTSDGTQKKQSFNIKYFIDP